MHEDGARVQRSTDGTLENHPITLTRRMQFSSQSEHVRGTVTELEYSSKGSLMRLTSELFTTMILLLSNLSIVGPSVPTANHQ